MTHGWVSYTSQFPTLIVTNIDMINLFKSRILQSFINFLIGAVVEDCGVFIRSWLTLVLVTLINLATSLNLARGRT